MGVLVLVVTLHRARVIFLAWIGIMRQDLLKLNALGGEFVFGLSTMRLYLLNSIDRQTKEEGFASPNIAGRDAQLAPQKNMM